MLTEFKLFWKNAFNFKGRATRREYWVAYMWILAITYVLLGISMCSIFLGIDYSTGDLKVPFVIGIISFVITCIYALVTLIPTISLCVRRCHDAGLSGWFYLLCIVGCLFCGLGGIGWIVISVLNSKPENKWGPNPKETGNLVFNDNTSIIIAVVAFVVSSIIYIVANVIGSVAGALSSNDLLSMANMLYML